MHIIIVLERATKNVVDKVEIKGAEKKGKEEVSRLIDATNKELLSKYPPDKYILYAGLSDDPENLKRTFYGKFRMEGAPSNLLLTNTGALILGIIVALTLISIRLLPMSVFVFVAAAVILYLIADFVLWEFRGVRAVEVDDKGISIFKGESKKPLRIDEGAITGVNIFRRFGREKVAILFGGRQISPLPGVTVFSGPRVLISEDAFDEVDFEEFAERMKRFHHGI